MKPDFSCSMTLYFLHVVYNRKTLGTTASTEVLKYKNSCCCRDINITWKVLVTKNHLFIKIQVVYNIIMLGEQKKNQEKIMIFQDCEHPKSGSWFLFIIYVVIEFRSPCYWLELFMPNSMEAELHGVCNEAFFEC